MRKFVEMPEQARQVLREDMLDQFAVLNEIIEYLALNDLPGAADVAENGMGQSLLRKHQDRDFGPGRYMPEAMRRMGWNLHEAASNFSLIAKRGNPQAAMAGCKRSPRPASPATTATVPAESTGAFTAARWSAFLTSPGGNCRQCDISWHVS